MRACLIVLVAVVGCGGGASGDDGTGDPGDSAQGMVKIDGEGSVTVKAQGGAAVSGSPFSCTGGNCSDEVVSTARSITFTPTPVATSRFARATIELGGSEKTAVN